MKIRKLLSSILALLMTASCMSFVAFAQEETQSTVTPLQISITSTNAKDQMCTKQDGFIDMLGRSVQKIIPDASVKPNNSLSPAYFSNTTTQRNAAYRTVKFVYYVSGSTTNVPTMNVFAWEYNESKGQQVMVGKGVVTDVSGKAPTANAWNTAIFNIDDSSIGADQYLYALMFSPYGGDQVKNHVGDTVYIGYIGLFDTVESAQAHTSAFEGDIAISAINVDGTAISGFAAATTEYTVDLAGKDYVPEVTATGTGNANGFKIETTAYDVNTGTATSTITAGETVYTVNFTGGAMSTSKTPIAHNLANTYTGANHGTSGKTQVADEFGRSHYKLIPDTTLAKIIHPGGDFGSTNTVDYTVLKVVYKTSESLIPSLSANAVIQKSDGTGTVWSKCSDGVAHYVVTPEAGKWNTVYYYLKNVKDTYAGEGIYRGITYWQLPLSTKKASETTESDYYYMGYLGLFGSIVDAKAHKTAFEGDLSVTSVKLGDVEIATTTGTYTYDVNGASSVPELTIAATGNTNNVVITNGEFDTDGNATSTVKNGDNTIITVNITGGAPKEVAPLIMPFEWNGYGNGIAGVNDITDEFTRTYKKYNPLWQYYEEGVNGEHGEDKYSESAVAPGGNITSYIPEGFELSDYSAIKIVYKSSDSYIPTLTQYDAAITNSNKPTAIYDVAPEANKWNVIYFDIDQLPVYQLQFTPDLSSNHLDGEYCIGYAAFFKNLSEAKAHKSVFEGDFAITDVLLDGASIGNVETYTKDLEGADSVPKLTVVATGDADGVTVTNGIIDAEGNATSTVKKGDTAYVTVNFTGASAAFKIIDIQVDGKSLKNFDVATTAYTMDLGFAAPEPVITYTHQGAEADVTVDIQATVVENVTTTYVATIKTGETVLYTITFNVNTEKPEALLNTLYKLQNDKTLTVGYFGGSVTAGSGASNTNNTSWRGLTRDWLKSTFSEATVTEVAAAIGGTGSIFGVFRADQDLIKEKAPDLIFVEMCINDTYDGIYGYNKDKNANIALDEQYVYIESIVKNIYDSNPKSDIVFVITGDCGTFSREINNGVEYGTPYKEIGAHYNIPVIYVGRELAQDVADSNGGVYSTDADLWKECFITSSGKIDTVHPNDKGYAHYANTLIEWMTPNLPTTYVPTESDYKDKSNPEVSYCETNNKGALMADATMVNPDKLNANYIGNFKIATGDPQYGGHPIRAYSEGDVMSLKFNGSSFGMWTWSYGETNDTNYKTGTYITYSIDGGEPQQLYVYRSFSNNKIYTLATGLSDGEHVIRIHHDDSRAPLFVYNFLIWDLHGREASVDTVPYFDFATEEYSVTLGGSAFADFNSATKTYQIPVELTSGQSYPALGFNVRDDFYGYKLTQADSDNNVAKLSIDNVGEYTFEFVNGNAVEVSSTTKSDVGASNGKVVFTEAAEYKLQLKNSKADWANATEYDIGTTEITGLAPGKYEIRYIIEDGVYGISESFMIYTNFNYDNVYYIKDGGTGDGTSAENAAAAGAHLNAVLTNAAAYFGAKAKTEDCYIVIVGDVYHTDVQDVDMKQFKNVIITCEFNGLFHMRGNIDFLNVTADCGKLTFKDVNVKLGNPNASSIDGEIMFHFAANEVEFTNVKITEWAKNSAGVTRTKGICFDYYGDGRVGATGLGRPITINSPELIIATVRLTGWGAGNETGNATFVLENANFATDGILKLGGHVNKETDTGVIKAYMNGGSVGTALVSGDTATIQVGTVALIHNGGTIGTVKVTSNSDTTETNVDRVAIFNNGTAPATLTSDKIDYIFHGAAGGSADITADDTTYRLTGFEFTTDKNRVIINKGLEDEKTLTVTEGKATLAVADLAAGEYTVTYEDAVIPEETVKVQASIKLGRVEGTKPATDNHLVVKIKNKATGEVVKTIDLEDENSVTDENGCLVLDLDVALGNVSGTELEIVAVKNGYAPYTLNASADTLEADIASFFEGMEEGFEKGHGDIKGSFDEGATGDGVIDIDDYIRVLRGFNTAIENTVPGYGKVVDLDENGEVGVSDLSVVKSNFGFGA